MDITNTINNMESPNITQILSKLTKEERFVLINDVMRAKADMDLKEGRAKQSFTPLYQVGEYLKTFNLK